MKEETPKKRQRMLKLEVIVNHLHLSREDNAVKSELCSAKAFRLVVTIYL